jgi:hypothetical protein
MTPSAMPLTKRTSIPKQRSSAKLRSIPKSPLMRKPGPNGWKPKRRLEQEPKLKRAAAQAHAVAAQADLAAALAYDDEATIGSYLQQCGYSNITDAQIAKVLAYMKDHWIHHVSQLGR